MEKLLKIHYNVFNDWNQLQQFLKRKGNPRYELVGDVKLRYQNDIFDLGNLVRVDGDLYLNYTPIESLGNLVRVEGNLIVHETSIQSLGSLEYVGAYLDLSYTSIQSLGNLKYVGDGIVVSSDHQIPPEQLTKFKDQIKYYY